MSTIGLRTKRLKKIAKWQQKQDFKKQKFEIKILGCFILFMIFAKIINWII